MSNVNVEATDTVGYRTASHTKICHIEADKSPQTLRAVSDRSPMPW